MKDFAKQSQVLLYMRTLEGTLSLRLGKNVWTAFKTGLVTKLDDPTKAPSAFMPEAADLARRFAEERIEVGSPHAQAEIGRVFEGLVHGLHATAPRLA